MNHQISLLLLLITFFFSCSKDELVHYQEDKDGIQFEYKSNQFKTIFDFAFQFEMRPDEWGYPMPYYYGDVLQEQKVKMIVSLLGRESDSDRYFNLKAKSGEGLHPELIVFEDQYVFRAGLRIDTVEVTLKRPVQRGEYNIEVVFDIADKQNDFGIGVSEKSMYTFQIRDKYPKPNDWDGRIAWLGEYSEDKYAFIVSELNIVYGYYVDWGQYNEQLRDALTQYNKKHPDKTKDFTFPINTDSIWWY